RLQAEHGLVCRFGLVKLPLLLTRDAQVEICLNEVWIELQRCLVGRHCACAIPLPHEEIAEIAVVVWHVLLLGNGLPEQRYGTRRVAGAARHHPKPMQGFGMSGVMLQHCAIERRRLRQVSLLEILQGLLQELLDRDALAGSWHDM